MLSKEYLQQYEQRLTQTLLERCTQAQMLEGELLESDDTNEIWDKFAPEYMADAVPNLNDYPAVAIAWAAYFGVAVASIWDTDWQKYHNTELYTALRDVRGFDEMDEYIVEEVLGLTLDSPENKKFEELLRSLAQTAQSQLRRENVEDGTTDAFYIFASTTKVFFKIGVALELHRRGYQYQKVNMQLPKEELPN